MLQLLTHLREQRNTSFTAVSYPGNGKHLPSSSLAPPPGCICTPHCIFIPAPPSKLIISGKHLRPGRQIPEGPAVCGQGPRGPFLFTAERPSF